MFVLSEDCCCKSALCCLLLTLVKSYSYSQSVSDISKAIKLLINVTDTFEFCDPVKMVRQTFYCSFLIQQIAGESFLGNNLPQNEKNNKEINSMIKIVHVLISAIQCIYRYQLQIDFGLIDLLQTNVTNCMYHWSIGGKCFMF